MSVNDGDFVVQVLLHCQTFEKRSGAQNVCNSIQLQSFTARRQMLSSERRRVSWCAEFTLPLVAE